METNERNLGRNVVTDRKLSRDWEPVPSCSQLGEKGFGGTDYRLRFDL
jgi:hypothetical protein